MTKNNDINIIKKCIEKYNWKLAWIDQSYPSRIYDYIKNNKRIKTEIKDMNNYQLLQHMIYWRKNICNTIEEFKYLQ